DIDIYDFTHYLLMANREPNENNPTLNRLIQAVKDMQKENEKGLKEASKRSAEEAKKGIKRDYSDTSLSNDEIKELLNNAEIPTSGRDAITFGTNNLNPEIVEFLHKNNKKMIIEKASNKELELLANANFRHPEDVRASLDHESITHILKRHGVNSVNVRNGESPITYEDIANYRDVVNNADEIIKAIGKGNKENITAFKQINGYAVVVEQAVNRNSELILKTMFKSNGDYKNNNAYKKFSSTGLNANAKVQP
ncbi:PBECR3 domain-containing polyvalent protein, partial [Helicobacter pylori]